MMKGLKGKIYEEQLNLLVFFQLGEGKAEGVLHCRLQLPQGEKQRGRCSCPLPSDQQKYMGRLNEAASGEVVIGHQEKVAHYEDGQSVEQGPHGDRSRGTWTVLLVMWFLFRYSCKEW